MNKTTYEQAAEFVALYGWQCKGCGQFYPGRSDTAERSARSCCAQDSPCRTPDCTGRAERNRIYCPACDSRREAEAFAALDRVSWDGETPMCEYRGDRYLYNADDVADYLAAHREVGLPIESVMLTLCEPVDARHFDVLDYLSDDMPEDYAPDGSDAIDATVNAWIKEAMSCVWTYGRKAIDPESLRAIWDEVKAEGGAA